MPADILSLRTALAVSRGYQYPLTNGIAISMGVLFCALSMIYSFHKLDLLKKSKSKWIPKVISIFIGFLSIAWINNVKFEDAYNIKMNLWWPAVTYEENGFLPAFISFAQRLKISQPEGYSTQDVNYILERLPAYEGPDDRKPTIIAIMNEAFSDLSALGPFDSSKNELRFYNALKSDPGTIEIGFDYVSTRGGGTSLTEFEFLTGNSMANILGTTPFTQFDFQHIPSIVSNLKEQGYEAIAMHPENPNNYKRSNVYASMGFDEFLSIDSFEGLDIIAGTRISDFGDYKKLIEVYEQRMAPLFVFNVTIQNHGGYDIQKIEDKYRVSLENKYDKYADVQGYQSLMKASDRALEYLINYFKNVDDPVIICMFGDHQPTLNKEFEQQLISEGRENDDTDLTIAQKYYSVPYFIWSNDPEIISRGENWSFTKKDIISPNYLSTMLQYYAGTKISAYNEFLLELRKKDFCN
ncbi:LTA synthase family protein [Clostridium sp. AM58-1XD]|uniref:LTA synthase family protein n=1 Tax=Clostridium sp. AM58-1XD TaxID=2292307 RepID=UPI0015F5E8AB|nr:LTA synthase family protein [Clostridium sp. AM58-1XD]